MRTTDSVENMYPPSYGSHASSSLSLGSSSGFQKNLNIIGPKVNSKENVSMYSSLPMVFPLTKYDDLKHHSHNRSDDRLVMSYTHQEKIDNSYQKSLVQPKVSYGSHFYTPSRGRRVPERKKKELCDQTKQTQLHLSLVRSSSDGLKRSPMENNVLDGIPSLPSNSAESRTVDPSSLEGEPLQSGDEKILQTNDPAIALSSQSSVHDLDGSLVNNSSFSHEFDFPSPPPIPSDCHADSACSSLEVQSERTSDMEAKVSPERNEGIGNVCFGNDSQSATVVDESNSKPSAPEDSVSSDKDENILSKDQKNGRSRKSLKKLSDVFGPEFITVSGLQLQEKKVNSSSLP